MGQPTDVVLEAIERFNAGRPEGFVELHADDAEMHDVPEIPGSTVYRGREGIEQWSRNVNELFEEITFHLSDPTERGELVALVTHARGKGRESGIELDWTFTTVWGVRDGRIYYHHGYSDHADALNALDEPPVR
jgi:ketosteroid isomerase-like protein